MFYLNNDDIDELFREAAENYLLSTYEAADWQKVNSAMREENNEIQTFKAKEKKKRRVVFWWFLLIPLGWFAHYAWNAEQKNAHLQKKDTDQKISVLNEQVAHVKTENLPYIKKQKDLQDTLIKKNIFRGEEKSTSTVKLAFVPHAAIADNDIYFKHLMQYANNETEKKNKVEVYTGIPYSVTDKMNINNEQDIKTTIAKKSAGTIATEDKILEVEENISPKNSSLKAKKPVVFYAGLSFSPDFSFIKFQKVSGIGTAAGITAGYKINNKLSIKTGVFFDKKKYYTKGSYFDKSMVPYLSNVNLISVDGNCNMIEIPLTVRYKLAANKSKGNWVTAIGVSSYFMNKEYYDYSFIKNGEEEHSDDIYHPSSTNLFAVINIGAGYEKIISKTLNLKIEPYVKIPLHGVGTGNLLISGTGINLGIIKYFH